MDERQVLELMRDVLFGSVSMGRQDLLYEIHRRLAALPAAAQADGEEPPTLAAELRRACEKAQVCLAEGEFELEACSTDRYEEIAAELMLRARPAPSHAFVDAERFEILRAARARESLDSSGHRGADCADCGLPYQVGLDAVVTNELWARIAPRADGGGILCLWCIDRRCRDRGVKAEVDLHFAGDAVHSASSSRADIVDAADAMRATLGKPWEFNHGHPNKLPEECPVCQAFRAYDLARSSLPAAKKEGA